MKTNILWRCQYCDKILGRKRTVLMHISNIHKADGENPVMYSPMTVSPKDVESLLKPKTVKSELKVTKSVSHVPHQTPEPQQTQEPQQTPEPQQNQEPLQNQTPQQTQKSQETPEPQLIPSLQQTMEPQLTPNLEATKSKKAKVIAQKVKSEKPKLKSEKPKAKSEKPKVKSEKPKAESVRSAYDFKRLVVHFDNPELVENAKPSSRKESDPRNSHVPEQQPTISNSESFPTGESNARRKSADSESTGSDMDKEPSYMPKKQTRSNIFTVPYKKPPRGKCPNWENCPNCSLVADCGQCRHCVDKSLR